MTTLDENAAASGTVSLGLDKSVHTVPQLEPHRVLNSIDKWNLGRGKRAQQRLPSTLHADHGRAMDSKRRGDQHISTLRQSYVNQM